MMLARMILAVLLLASAAGGAATQRADAAAGWPARPIKLIVPFFAGSSTDAIGRILAQSLAARLGEPVVIEKRADGTPQPTVAKLNDAIGKSLDDADVKTSLTIQGFEAEPDRPEALRDRVAADIGKWPTVGAKAGIQPELRLRSDGR
jgi:tripartite-type tricarboxylate transporter receptor subunit TctC